MYYTTFHTNYKKNKFSIDQQYAQNFLIEFHQIVQSIWQVCI